MNFDDLLTQIGVDGPATVARLGGMEAILRRLILRLPEDQTFPSLAQAYDSGDMEALGRHVHTLKGMTANLGIEPLRRMSASYLESIRQGKARPDLTAHQREITQEYQRVVRLISKFLEENPA